MDVEIVERDELELNETIICINNEAAGFKDEDLDEINDLIFDIKTFVYFYLAILLRQSWDACIFNFRRLFP